ncbi:MAG: DUF2848 family protein [Chloroflexota bacterium]|nr:DUF2848 family protein [Chloroflexota bacterium]MDE2885160.1 DUF2848 family protein [Chloroflexota bacterium]
MSGEGIGPVRKPGRTLTFDHAGAPMRFTARRLLAGGYTGRDPAAVEEHIAELALLGVPRPDHVPWIFVANPQVLQVDGTVWAYDGTSSGEAEYVLLIGRDDIFVCIGSDHTDRGLESLSIEKSKQVYPKILSRQVWRLDDLLPHWDDLRLRSRVQEGGEPEDYQHGTLAQLIRPERLLDLVGPDPGAGTAVFSGTLPVLGGNVRPAPRFEAELFDTDGRSLAALAYDVVVLQPQVQPDER